VIAALQELNPVGLDQVVTALLLRNAPGPDIGPEVFQRFGLADTIKGVSQNGFILQQPLCGAAVRFNPVLQVF